MFCSVKLFKMEIKRYVTNPNEYIEPIIEKNGSGSLIPITSINLFYMTVGKYSNYNAMAVKRLNKVILLFLLFSCCFALFVIVCIVFYCYFALFYIVFFLLFIVLFLFCIVFHCFLTIFHDLLLFFIIFIC